MICWMGWSMELLSAAAWLCGQGLVAWIQKLQAFTTMVLWYNSCSFGHFLHVLVHVACKSLHLFGPFFVHSRYCCQPRHWGTKENHVAEDHPMSCHRKCTKNLNVVWIIQAFAHEVGTSGPQFQTKLVRFFSNHGKSGRWCRPSIGARSEQMSCHWAVVRCPGTYLSSSVDLHRFDPTTPRKPFPFSRLSLGRATFCLAVTEIYWFPTKQEPTRVQWVRWDDKSWLPQLLKQHLPQKWGQQNFHIFNSERLHHVQNVLEWEMSARRNGPGAWAAGAWYPWSELFQGLDWDSCLFNGIWQM